MRAWFAVSFPGWLSDILPIVILLAVVAIVVGRLPKVDLGHSPAYLRRRVQNWLTVGLTYAFLYMGRYNLAVCATALGTRMSNQEFGTILASGSMTYGLSFWINGPLADRFGGRKTIILGAAGSALMNVAMGAMLATTDSTTKLVLPFSILYSLNMYFQSFGAVSIIKVNSAWFHVRERGTFSGVFGILISLGFYFAFDWGSFIAHHAPLPFVFFIPAGILALFAILDILLVRDAPSEAGFPELDTGDASSGDDGPRLPVFTVIKKMFRDPIIMTIALVEFCSGYLRDSITQWYNKFAALTGNVGFVTHHFGMLTCTAGIAAGVVAGIISDRVFQSRRGPVATVLYGALLFGTLLMYAFLSSPLLGFVHLHFHVRHRRSRNALRNREHGFRRKEERGRRGRHHRRLRLLRRGHQREGARPRLTNRRRRKDRCELVDLARGHGAGRRARPLSREPLVERETETARRRARIVFRFFTTRFIERTPCPPLHSGSRFSSALRSFSPATSLPAAVTMRLPLPAMRGRAMTLRSPATGPSWTTRAM